MPHARDTRSVPATSLEGAGPRVLVLGAGPTGLGAGSRLLELGHTNFTVVDRHAYAGGLAHSFVKDGFTWDVGGHVMFSHYDYYDRLFERLMGGNYTMNDRESWVRVGDRWVPYPFQNNIRYLPKDLAYECISGLLRAQAGLTKDQILERARAAPNFGAFIDVVFGEGIVKHFMRPYNFKVWAHPPEMMNKEWIGERVAVLDAERALRNLVLEQDDFGWGPNNRFKYPLRGGTGAFYDAIAREIANHLVLNKNVRTIDVDAKLVTFEDGSTDTYDHLISAMPLDVLARDVLIGDVPQNIRTRAAQLMHSSGHMVGLGIRRPCPSTKSWMYFPDDNCPFYRVTYLSNYSPYMTPDQSGENATHYSLLCEVAESAHKPVDGGRVVEDVITGLENAGLLEPGERADIVSVWHHRAEYSYPTPSVERDAILADVLPWLESRDILSRGRFGLWKYEVSNTDHTLMQGVEAVNRLLLGEAETTVGIVYQATPDGRKAAVHERSAQAGSGEKRMPGGAPVPSR
ncbi:MAG: amine oxidase [Phycisphaerales bacterium]|nr:MAG: amine oxidase [Phycisphaerales bacterium]